MRLFLRALAALAFVCLFVAPAHAERDSDNAAAPALGPPVVALTSTGGSSGFCTAFLISSSRLITAGHCVMSKSSPLKVLFQNKRSVKVDVLFFANPMLGMGDFAVLELPASERLIGDRYAALDLDCTAKVAIGDNVRIEGFPTDMGFTVVWGRVSRGLDKWAPTWERPVFGINGAVAPANSGSPVIDEKTGKVIGILTGAEPSNRSLAVAQPISDVCHAIGYTTSKTASFEDTVKAIAEQAEELQEIFE